MEFSLALVALVLDILDLAAEEQISCEWVYQILSGYQIPNLRLKTTRMGVCKEEKMTGLR